VVSETIQALQPRAENETLASIILPDVLGLRRDRVVPERYLTPAFDAGYDFTTLIYDAVSIEGRGVWLFCPKLRNFEQPLWAARIEIDGAPCKLKRIRRFERYDIAEIPCATPARRLRLSFAGWEAELPVSPDETARFAGLNCLLTLSRNNDLRWVRDWTRYHVAEHGAEALLFYDNASSEYGTREILEAVSGIPGLRMVRVLRVPFLYGPQASRRLKFRANFLQAALLNLARWRFLAKARAVLSCDIDEIVVRRTPSTIFNAAQASRSGFVRVRGEWRFPNTAQGQMPVHRDHFLTGNAVAHCPPKYCIVPDGRMRRKSWATHGLHGSLFSRRFISPEFVFLHCFGISDFWKGRPSRKAEEARRVDDATRTLLAQAFPDADTPQICPAPPRSTGDTP
jgi:hypothetical protein